MKIHLACTLAFCLLFSCSSPKNGLKVAATAVPHAELLEFIKPDLKEQGIDLQILVAEDYNLPNRALADKEVDANFFQHLPFLENQIEQFQYPIESIGTVELEPIGIYSSKVKSLSDLKEKGVIALPNDPTNEGRALKLLQKAGIIELDNRENLHATVLNITKNPKNLQFVEVDAAMVARSLEDVDAGVINSNFALQAGLSPLQDALLLEDKNSPYANVLVVRTGEGSRPDIQALKKALTSEKMEKFISEKYRGAIIPTFSSP